MLISGGAATPRVDDASTHDAGRIFAAYARSSASSPLAKYFAHALAMSTRFTRSGPPMLYTRLGGLTRGTANFVPKSRTTTRLISAAAIGHRNSS